MIGWLWVAAAALAVEGTVTLPLSALEGIEAAPAQVAPSVRMGRAEWTGVVDADTGAIELDAKLVVDLRGDGFKEVPLVGEAAVLSSVEVAGRAVPVTVAAGHHVWRTDAVGPVVVRVRGWLPPTGQRGSLEYDVAIPQTPSTRLQLTLSQPDMRPEVRDAVRSEVVNVGGQTVLTADLKPTKRLHVLGLRDLRNEAGRPPELYAETSQLVSIDDHRVEVFAAVRYSILYNAAQRFDVFVPEGLSVVDADGEGAFQYELVDVPGGTLLQGETRHPIRNRYELSLWLQRNLPDGELELALPTARGVQREHGWVGLEVPGRVRVTDTAGTGLQPLQIAQLPTEVRESSVSPILEAWRLDGDPTLTWTATRLPEVEVSAERIDQVHARSVVAAGGRVVTELSLQLQNRSRHGLRLELPEGTTVTRASRDGQAVVPAAADGGVVLPLRRTSGTPQTLQVVLSHEDSAPGLRGQTDLALPSLDLPIAALSWTVHLPESHRWGALEADVRSQTRVGSGSWLADGGASPASAAIGEVGAPEAGEVRHYERFWVGSEVAMEVSVGHTAPWLWGLLRLGGLFLLGGALAGGAWGRSRWARRPAG